MKKTGGRLLSRRPRHILSANLEQRQIIPENGSLSRFLQQTTFLKDDLPAEEILRAGGFSANEIDELQAQKVV